MSISVDNGNAGVNLTAVSTASYTHTNASNANLLVVELEVTAANSVSALIYGGVSFTGNINQSAGIPSLKIYLYWLFNPPTGANTLSITMSGSGTIVMRSASYIGVDTSFSPDTNLTGATTASTFTTNAITPTRANSWVIGVLEESQVGSSAGTGTTFRAGVGNGDGIFDTNGPVSSPTSLQAICSPAHFWTGTILAFAPISSIPNKLVFVRQAVNRANTY